MKKIKSSLVVFLAGMVVFMGLPQVVWAKVDEFCTSTGHGADSSDPQINTALGCVPVKIDDFVLWLLPKLFGVAGGVAFLLMVYGFFVVGTSGGNPKKVAGGQETITSAVTGLLLSVFALFILRLIAVDILKIPGF